MFGEVLGAILCAALEAKLIVGELIGAEEEAQGLAFILFLGATLVLIAYGTRWHKRRKPPYTL